MLKVKNICKSFGDSKILDGISFNVDKGDVICVLGPSGAGKTTLLRCMNFLVKADEGSVELDNKEYSLTKSNSKEINEYHKKTGFVFQSFNLFSNKTVLENVTEGLIIARKMDKQQAIEIASNALKKVGMYEKKDSYPSSLSGGQQQRVSIARAIAYNPEIIYFDEPTSALDPELTKEVLKVISDLAKDGVTMIIVTHEMSFAENVANKIIFMEKGNIVEENNSKDFFHNPKSERSREFIGGFKYEETTNNIN